MFRRRDMRDPCRVYFVRPVGSEGPVKIGCSLLPENRLAALAVWSPVPLEIVALLEGDESLERRFHASFREDWSHGEWFKASERLSETIKAIATGSFDVDALPIGVRLPTKRQGTGWTEFSRLSASMNRRLAAVGKRGVQVPETVRRIAHRYNAGPYGRQDGPPHLKADADFVQSFLAEHGYEPRPVPDSPTSGAA